MAIAIIIVDLETSDEYRIELSEKPVEVGRSSKCDVTVKDKKASGQHCGMCPLSSDLSKYSSNFMMPYQTSLPISWGVWVVQSIEH